MFELVAWWVFTTVVSYALRPKPQVPNAPRPAGLNEFQVPTASAGRPVPVLFGTRWLKGANVVWYGNLGIAPIRESSGGKK